MLFRSSTSVTFKKIPRDSSNTNAGNHEQIRGTNQRVGNTRRIPSSSALVSGQQQRNKVSAINKLQSIFKFLQIKGFIIDVN